MKERQKQFDIERKIDLYVNGRLDQIQIDALWVELIENPSYYEYLKTSAALRSMFSKQELSTSVGSVQTGDNSVSKVYTLPTAWKKYAAAAVILIATGTTVIYLQNSSSNGVSITGPLDSLELIVYRSTDSNVTTDSVPELREAVNLALTGNTSSAIILLTTLLENTNTPEIQAEALLNIGIIEYNNDDFNAALQSLKRASALEVSDRLLLERIIWNLSHAQMAVGDNQSARESVLKVIEFDGAHSRMAQNYLKYLR